MKLIKTEVTDRVTNWELLEDNVIKAGSSRTYIQTFLVEKESKNKGQGERKEAEYITEIKEVLVPEIPSNAETYTDFTRSEQYRVMTAPPQDISLDPDLRG